MKCADAVLRKYQSGSQHFLCLASPGAGKTVMAAEVARRMLERNLVDLIICFAPSSSVVSSITATFSRILDKKFDGGLGATGAAFTYHNLMYFDESFWNSLHRHRVFVVFDEIHHCAGDSPDNANMWGGEILAQVQKCAHYTLALTGTPWRTDNAPIVLSKYTDPDGKICCDYTYSLHDAIVDKVCRRPKIVLVNSNHLVFTSEDTVKRFSSFADLLTETTTSYQSVLRHPEAIKYVLKAGCEKLHELRKNNPNAGGLVVASSVDHARQILDILEQDLTQTAMIVTYHDQDALLKIANFRKATTEWIVSIGMISEGTDIPRLQVCCHLSTVKTELYFRQVLGRILRVNQSKNQEAWLFTLATDEMALFSERLAEDLPDDYRVLQKQPEASSSSKNEALSAQQELIQTNDIAIMKSLELKILSGEESINIPSFTHSPKTIEICSLYQKIIDAFLFPAV